MISKKKFGEILMKKSDMIGTEHHGDIKISITQLYKVLTNCSFFCLMIDFSITIVQKILSKIATCDGYFFMKKMICIKEEKNVQGEEFKVRPQIIFFKKLKIKWMIIFLDC